MRHKVTVAVLATLLAGWAVAVAATELVHTPVNPNFGGNPLNGPFLLSQAAAQNKFKESTPSLTPANPMKNFEDTLTRSLLSMLANRIAEASFGNGTVASDVPYEFNGYTILVQDQGNAMLVTITDPYGGQTSMTVGRFNGPDLTP